MYKNCQPSTTIVSMIAKGEGVVEQMERYTGVKIFYCILTSADV